MDTMKLFEDMKKIQQSFKDIQDKLGGVTVRGMAGGGMVTVDMNGRNEVTGVHIDKELFDTGDSEMLEDLIAGAFNDATEKARAAGTQEAMSMASQMGYGDILGGH